MTAKESLPVLMRKVYTWMAMALVITGITAYGVASSPAILQALYGSRILFFGLIIAELALVWGVSARIEKLSLTTATLLFILYSVINGATLSYIFLAYTMASISKVFFYFIIRYWRIAIIDHIHFFWDYVDCCHTIILR